MPVIDREAYAIMYTVQKLDYYLSGAVFKIKTDHKPLKYLLETEWINKKIPNWTDIIVRLSGKKNICADLLSRITRQLDWNLDG